MIVWMHTNTTLRSQQVRNRARAILLVRNIKLDVTPEIYHGSWHIEIWHQLCAKPLYHTVHACF